jgi:ATPase subunit of ABC transporter with duplicated ATPase domains
MVETSSPLTAIVQSQLTSLDDTDALQNAWTEALARATENGSALRWGGRGRGGRGLARRTFQPKDIVVEGIRLEYVGTTQGSSRVLLGDDAVLKLLGGRAYAVVGRNGCGKSTLLRRIRAGKIPGFPPHVTTLYIPQEIFVDRWEGVEDDAGKVTPTPIDYLLEKHRAFTKDSANSVQEQIDSLEAQLESLDITLEEDQEKIQQIGEEISLLEDSRDGKADEKSLTTLANEALECMGLAERIWNMPMTKLSAGQRKKVALSLAFFCCCDLLLLDEPTNALDVQGLLQLRRLMEVCKTRQTTVLLVSHDLDLVNHVATDVIEFVQKTLYYYPGNYADYQVYRRQHDLHNLRQVVALDKKRDAMMQTIENIKKQPVPKRGGGKKKSRQVESHRKKLERQGFEKTESGHRWTAQKAGTGIKAGSINAIDATTRRGKTTSQLLTMTEKDIRPPPDKAVQFVFRPVTSQWNEALIWAMQVGHGYGQELHNAVAQTGPVASTIISKKEGFLFDCVDLCVEEGGTYCILGETASGKSILLRLLAKLEEPREGKISYATNVEVAFMDQESVERMIDIGLADGTETALSYLQAQYRQKTEQDLRSELTNFGMSPTQATTNLRFLSGGERNRVCLASVLLGNPQVLVLDQPTSNLDVESVEALIYGLRGWNGTVVISSHDANFVRSVEAQCYALVANEGKLRRVDGGIDEYLRAFATE